MTQTDIFGDRDAILKVWQDERRSRDFNASLMWENLKFFSVLISAIITADTFFLKFASEVTNSTVISLFSIPVNMIYLFSIPIPILVIFLSKYGKQDLRRRWSRTLEAIAHLSKLENLLGLDKEVAGKLTNFKNDTYLFDRFTKDTKHMGCQDDFIKKVMKEDKKAMKKETKENESVKGNMYIAMRKVYFVFYVMGYFLIFIHIVAAFLLTAGT
jgi:hypothetical protein